MVNQVNEKASEYLECSRELAKRISKLRDLYDGAREEVPGIARPEDLIMGAVSEAGFALKVIETVALKRVL